MYCNANPVTNIDPDGHNGLLVAGILMTIIPVVLYTPLAIYAYRNSKRIAKLESELEPLLKRQQVQPVTYDTEACDKEIARRQELLRANPNHPCRSWARATGYVPMPTELDRQIDQQRSHISKGKNCQDCLYATSILPALSISIGTILIIVSQENPSDDTTPPTPHGDASSARTPVNTQGQNGMNIACRTNPQVI